MSAETVLILKTIQESPKLLWNKNPPWKTYEQDYDYYKEALNQIVEAAKKDLKV